MKQLVWFFSIALAFTAGYVVNTFFTQPQPVAAQSGTSANKAPAKDVAASIERSDTNINQSESAPDNVQPQSDNYTVPSNELAEQLMSLTSSDPSLLSFSDIAEIYLFIAELSEQEVVGLIDKLFNKNIEDNVFARGILISRYAEVNPRAALDAATNDVYDKNTRTAFLTTGLMSLAKQDPVAAYDYFLQISNADSSQPSHNHYMVTGTLITTFSRLARQDMTLAIDKLAELNQLGHNLTIPTLGLTQSLDSKQEFVDLLTLTQRIDNHDVEEGIVKQWATKDPEQVGAWLTSEYSGTRYDELKSTFVSAWAQNDRTKSANWLVAHSSAETLRRDVVDLIHSWSWENPEAAMQWFKQQPANVYNQETFGEVIDGLAFTHPQFAAKQLSYVTSEERRSEISRSIYRGFKRKSTTQAAQFIEQSPFREEILEYEARF